MTIFADYAKYYDLFNKDKDYQAEVRYLTRVIESCAPRGKRLLELGCGTGKYCRSFSDLGYCVVGIDRSPQMITLAKGHPCDTSEKNVSYSIGDIRSFRDSARFDVVVSLFHVVSYQITDEDLAATFRTAREQLGEGGLFLFDCWNGPGVLGDPPKNPVKMVQSDQVVATRKTTSTLMPDKKIVRVCFEMEIEERGTGEKTVMAEEHTMRFLFSGEVENLAAAAGMRVIKAYRWLTEDEPDDSAWYVLYVLGVL